MPAAPRRRVRRVRVGLRTVGVFRAVPPPVQDRRAATATTSAAATAATTAATASATTSATAIPAATPAEPPAAARTEPPANATTTTTAATVATARRRRRSVRDPVGQTASPARRFDQPAAHRTHVPHNEAEEYAARTPVDAVSAHVDASKSAPLIL